jgi:heterodisulfide reductase subunit B
MFQNQVALFPGCVISYRLPFIEVSVRRSLDFLEISYNNDSRFSCCPDPNGIKNSNKLLYYLTAARNLALAESKNQAIVTPCNGCYTTLKKTRCEIEEDHHFRRKLNNYLNKIDLEVQGTSQVYHIVEFFFKFNREAIKNNLKFPLTGLRVALHYGCHFLRPSNKLQLDDPLKPTLFDDLIRDLGAEGIEYDLKMECCGGSLERAGKPSLALEMIKAKLSSINKVNVDCIVVCCPQCYIQFDHQQRELKKKGFQFDIPVLYYSELLCIALGIDVQEIIRKYHRTNVNSLFEKISTIQEKNFQIQQNFNLSFLIKCHACRACEDDCLLSKMTEFSPNKIISMILQGKINEAISDPSIWMCLDCYLCYELCPLGVGYIEIFTILRNLATKQGHVTKGYESEFNSFRQKGIIGVISKSARKRVNLEDFEPNVSDLKELFNLIESKSTEINSQSIEK